MIPANCFRLLANEPPATEADRHVLLAHFGEVPDEYFKLIANATDVELLHSDGQYIRIWGPKTCIDQDEGYGFRKRLNGAIPIGDDGGGRVIIYADGHKGKGLYIVDYGNLDLDDAVWIAPSLSIFLSTGTGIEFFE